MNRNLLKKKIAGEFSKIKSKRGVYAFISKQEDYAIANQEIMRFLTKNLRSSGIYVALSKSHCSVVKELEEQGINTKKIMFIDNNEDGNGCGAPNCIFLGTNKSLTALSLAMTETSKDKSMRFIFFDSITTLLIYNELNLAERFVHYFINKIKNLNVLMVIISVDEEKTKKLIPILAQFCDGVVRL